MITIEQAATIRVAYIHIADRRARAKPHTSRVVEARVNGALKTWKTRPQDFRLPMKYGLKECFYITPDNAADWHATEEEAATAPVVR